MEKPPTDDGLNSDRISDSSRFINAKRDGRSLSRTVELSFPFVFADPFAGCGCPTNSCEDASCDGTEGGAEGSDFLHPINRAEAKTNPRVQASMRIRLSLHGSRAETESLRQNTLKFPKAECTSLRAPTGRALGR